MSELIRLATKIRQLDEAAVCDSKKDEFRVRKEVGDIYEQILHLVRDRVKALGLDLTVTWFGDFHLTCSVERGFWHVDLNLDLSGESEQWSLSVQCESEDGDNVCIVLTQAHKTPEACVSEGRTALKQVLADLKGIFPL